MQTVIDEDGRMPHQVPHPALLRVRVLTFVSIATRTHRYSERSKRMLFLPPHFL